jgi:hypothetical protein
LRAAVARKKVTPEQRAAACGEHAPPPCARRCTAIPQAGR